MMKKIIIGLLLFVGVAPVFASEWDLPGITIISRAQRGADESLRYTEMSYEDRKNRLQTKTDEELKRLEETDFDEFFSKQKEEYENAIRFDYLQTNYTDDQKIDAVIYQNGKNNLKWPQTYHNQKSKIIVHHTAGDTSSFTGGESVLAYLKDVYKFHTLTRGRGDLGYNFLIDPYGNIYEGRAGGDSVIGAHTSLNNTPSVGVSLMGNFDKQKPTKAQINSLISLIAVLSKKYNIDPTATAEYHKKLTKEPYIKTSKAGTIAGHKDAGVTSCPGKNLYSQLSDIKSMVVESMAKGVLVSSTQILDTVPTITTIKTTASKTGFDMLKTRQKSFDKITDAAQKAYIQKKGTKKAMVFTSKITSKINQKNAKNLINSDISVLLYELSREFVKWDIVCSGGCSFVLPSGTYKGTTASIEIAEGGLLLDLDGKKYIEASIAVQAKENNLVKVSNYSRISYFKIPRNTFYGSLIFQKGQIKNLKTDKFENQYIVVNTLPFQKYLKGVVETNDSEHKEKIKTMNLISKTYALFYMDGKNKHPSIPEGAAYRAIDNPEMFQKYVGAGAEKTLKIVPSLIEEQKNEIILFDTYVPILPYFNCSPGFTRSAKDKRGWSDTPYLVSRIDMEKCSDFNGHGVGLSGKGAQYFAKKGWTYKEILQYYYPNIQIISL